MVYCCHFALLIAISIQAVVSYASPRLALRQTNDVTFTCSTSDLRRPMHALSALQIARTLHTGGSQEDIVLATADASGFRASAQLNPFVNAVTGTVNSTGGRIHEGVNTTMSLFRIDGKVGMQKGRDSWLMLTIPDVTTRDFGTYLCRVVYAEHSGDSNMTAVLLGSVEIRSSSADTSLHGDKSFKAHFSKGVAMVCEFGDTGDVAAKWNVSIIREKADTLLAVSSDNVKTNNSPRLLSVPMNATGTSFILNTHLVNVSCQDQGAYVCSVQDQSDRRRNSAQQTVSLDGCTDGCKVSSCTATVSAEKEKNRTVGPTSHDNTSVSVGVSVFFVLGIVMCSLCLVLKLRGCMPEFFKYPITLMRFLSNRMIFTNDDQSAANDERRSVAYRPTLTANMLDETSFITINLHGQMDQRLTADCSSVQHLQASSHVQDLTGLRLHVAFDTKTSPLSDGHEDESRPCKRLTKKDASAPPLASYRETHPQSDTQCGKILGPTTAAVGPRTVVRGAIAAVVGPKTFQVGFQESEASSYCELDPFLQETTCTDTGGRVHERVKAESSDVESDDLGKALVVHMPKYTSDNSDEDNDEEDRLLSQPHPDSPRDALNGTTAASMLNLMISDNSREGEMMRDTVFSLPVQVTEENGTYCVVID